MLTSTMITLLVWHQNQPHSPPQTEAGEQAACLDHSHPTVAVSMIHHELYIIARIIPDAWLLNHSFVEGSLFEGELELEFDIKGGLFDFLRATNGFMNGKISGVFAM